MSSAISNGVALERTTSNARPAALITVVAALGLLYLGAGVWDHAIWSPTEPAVAGVVWNMNDGAGLAVPRINEMAYLEKPPFYYWLSLLSVRVFGLQPSALRLPSAILGLGALCTLWFAVRRHYGTFVATVTAPLVGSFFSFWEVTHRASTDAGALFFSFLAYSVFFHGLEEEPREGRLPYAHDLAFAGVLALSFLVKNLFVPFVVLVPVSATLVVLRRWRRLARLWALFGALLAAVVVPWGVVLLHEGGWPFVKVAFFENTIGRFFELRKVAECDSLVLNDARVVERQGPAFYLVPLLLMSLPWSAIVLPSLLGSAREVGRSARRTFLVVGFASAFLALSASASKAVEYLLPLEFFLGLAAAEWIRTDLGRARHRDTFVLGHVWLFGALFAAVPVAVYVKTGIPIALAAAVLTLVLFVVSLSLPRLRESLPTALVLVVLAETAALGALVPVVDRSKSAEPFFALVRPALPGREVITNLRDDRSLPLINFSLRRRVMVLADERAVAAALAGPKPVAAIVRGDFGKRLGPFPRGLRLQRLQAAEGKRGLVCLLNLPQGGTAASPAGAPALPAPSVVEERPR